MARRRRQRVVLELANAQIAAGWISEPVVGMAVPSAFGNALYSECRPLEKPVEDLNPALGP
jgi:hypothetical protein